MGGPHGPEHPLGCLFHCGTPNPVFLASSTQDSQPQESGPALHGRLRARAHRPWTATCSPPCVCLHPSSTLQETYRQFSQPGPLPASHIIVFLGLNPVHRGGSQPTVDRRQESGQKQWLSGRVGTLPGREGGEEPLNQDF